jgi:undecaprenyl-diphosphatase
MAYDEHGSQHLRPRAVIDGSYRLEEKIAVGTTSALWKATDVQRDRVVALRFVFGTPNEAQLRRFIAEAESLAAIQNAHVAAVYQCGISQKVGGLPYVAIEWLSGRDLAEELAERTRLPADEVIRYGLQLCEGLSALHERKLHRSINPSSIFLSGDPSARAVKLLDRRMEAILDLRASRLTPGRTTSGLEYMSPEQLTNGRNLDERSDVWSVGMVLYEALSGGLPFAPEASPTEVIATVLAGHFPLDDIPSALKPIVDRCLSAREERFDSANELAEALRRAGTARPSSTGRSARAKTPPLPTPMPPAAPAGARQATSGGSRALTWVLALAGAIVTLGALVGVSPLPFAARLRPMSVTLLLGIVEGLTEYLPVSSTGHLALVGHILGLPDDAATSSFEIVIQLGAILAVVVQYRTLLADRARGLVRRERASVQLLLALAIAFAPAAFVGLLFRKAIKVHLFKPLPIAAALVVGGVAMIIVERIRARRGIKGQDGLERVTPWRALAIGVGQCFSLWPGSSRSMCTIIAAQLSGLSTATAAEFSFLLALPTLGAATVFEGYKARSVLLGGGAGVHLAVGLVVSFLVAWAVIASFLKYLRARGLEPFGWYRIVVGAIALWVLAR